ncbi:hypothetical protein ABTX15_30820 [Micromonospora sp. NPDC094482]|uniref:hypothetical protein n=1 Tax=unclassified Micromonospora TaxID=2617518 RepID=UPI0033326E4C
MTSTEPTAAEHQRTDQREPAAISNDGRPGGRSDADLAWDTELLQHLGREGLTVPAPIPTMDGRLFADGLVVMTYLEGGPPETQADWRRVAGALRELYRLTQVEGLGWCRRPRQAMPAGNDGGAHWLERALGVRIKARTAAAAAMVAPVVKPCSK